jgi:hypothetical protein
VLGCLLSLSSQVAAVAQPAPDASIPDPAPATPAAPPPSSGTPTASSAPPAPPPVPATPRIGADRLVLSLGVVVASADDASVDAAWQLASMVYADPRLRPAKLDDATARVLAGDPPGASATPRQVELHALRLSFAPGSPSSARLLAALCAETAASAIVVVHTDTTSQVHAVVFAAVPAAFVDHDLQPSSQANKKVSWASTLAWLQGHIASKPQHTPSRAPSRAPRQPEGTFFASGWFWGAVVMAAGAAVVAWSVSSRDQSPTTIHLQGRVQR